MPGVLQRLAYSLAGPKLGSGYCHFLKMQSAGRYRLSLAGSGGSVHSADLDLNLHRANLSVVQRIFYWVVAFLCCLL